MPAGNVHNPAFLPLPLVRGFFAMSDATAPGPAAPARWSPLRIVLFALLAAAVVALGIDLAARLPANQAYSKLNAMLDEEDIGQRDLSASGPRTPTEIHKAIGHEPNSSEQQADELHETYRWQGVFKAYTVHAVYTGATLNLDDPTKSEPLLSKVGYMGPPE
jgi:hypothetical protein